MLMRVRHQLRPSEPDDFGFVTTQEFLDLYQKVTTGVYSALVGLVAISLVVGGIVVMNIMLVAVTERTREIGIRKAVGARRRDVLRQFLTEAVILAAIGGLIGVAFGFAIAVHPRDPDTAWRVPVVSDACRLPVDGQVVVARTRDGGASWELLRQGLPQRHAYHLALRHALDVDLTGDRLALGSNIGGLWISEDGGDHWHEISRDLPPVNAVRLG